MQVLCNISKFWNCIILFSYEGIDLALRVYGFEILKYIFHLFQCLWYLSIKLPCIRVKVTLHSQAVFTYILCWFFFLGLSYEEIRPKTFLDFSTELLKVTISFVMSPRLSVRMEQLGSYWRDFHNNMYFSIFRKRVEKIQYSLKSNRNNGYCTVLCCTVLYCTVLCCAVLYCTVLYCAVLYSAILYCTVLYCTVLRCAVLCCTVLYCTVLYCAVLCCTVLYWYCTVLYCAVLYCTVHED